MRVRFTVIGCLSYTTAAMKRTSRACSSSSCRRRLRRGRATPAGPVTRDRLAGLRRARSSRRPSARRPTSDETVIEAPAALVRRSRRARTACRRSTACPAASEDGKPVGWFYYVNGIEADEAAASASSTRATGSGGTTTTQTRGAAFPRSSARSRSRSSRASEGKKLPIRLVCMGDEERSCDEVETRLQAAGIKDLARSNLESVGRARCCGSWSGRGREVRKDIAARTLESGPRPRACSPSPTPSGGKLALLDADGDVGEDARPRQRAGRGDDATPDQQPTWLITGTDDVGVAAAAAAIERGPAARPLRAGDRGRARVSFAPDCRNP